MTIDIVLVHLRVRASRSFTRSHSARSWFAFLAPPVFKTSLLLFLPQILHASNGSPSTNGRFSIPILLTGYFHVPFSFNIATDISYFLFSFLLIKKKTISFPPSFPTRVSLDFNCRQSNRK